MKRLLIFIFACLLFLNANSQDINLSETKGKVVFESEQPNYVVGNIVSATFANDRIVITDNDDTKILALDAKGNLIGNIGRQGRGPGEYINPTSIDFSNNRLTLLDSGLNKISSYLLDKKTGQFELTTSGTFNLNMTDFCISNDALWVYANNGEAIIHQITYDLQSKSSSISDGFDKKITGIMEIARKGSIACQDNLVFAGYAFDNILKVYDAHNNNLIREIEFDGISPVEISEVEFSPGRKGYSKKYYTGSAYNAKGNFHDTLRNLIILDDHLLVQYMRTFEKSEEPEIVSLFLNLNNWTYTETSNLSLIFSYRDGSALSGNNFPLPRLKVIDIYN